MMAMPDYEEDYRCPRCLGALEMDTDCPGYTGHDGRVWKCSGGSCGNGVVVSCVEEHCSYAHFPEGTIREGYSDAAPVASTGKTTE